MHHALQTTLKPHTHNSKGAKSTATGYDLTSAIKNRLPMNNCVKSNRSRITYHRAWQADSIAWKLVPLAEARKEGAMMLFGEKNIPTPYAWSVWAIFPANYAGGIHLDNTQEVGSIEILNEESVSAGTRRITALTGRGPPLNERSSRKWRTNRVRFSAVPSINLPRRRTN
ncbi:MAG: hypothetical protein WKF73_14090 [Nocardioidaceae bacterium]